MARDLADQIVTYLSDAHSIEEQALVQLRRAPDLAGDPEIAAAFREHLAETERHEQTTREQLERRGGKPNLLKDTAMRAGGIGFALFAKLQPDTPGKLLAHAHSYEALELAAYDLLARTAELGGDTELTTVATQIGEEERAMRDRLLGLADRAVDASLRAVGADDLRERLRRYLSDAHAIEAQSIQLLERGPRLAGDERLAALYEEHLAETRDHQELVAERLAALGGSPSALKDAALRLGALNWGLFFALHPDTPGKLAAFAYAFEHLEIGGYELLRRVAGKAGEGDTLR